MQRFRVTLVAVRRPFEVARPEEKEFEAELEGLMDATSNC
jgi:hypothetical protein